MGAERVFLRPSKPAGNGVLFKSWFRGEIDTPFDISRADDGPVRVLNLRGTIIAGNDRGMLHDKIQEYIDAEGTNFILDLAQVTQGDSTGIGALIDAFNMATRKGGCVKLVHLTNRIHQVIQIARRSTVFGIYDDLQKAVDWFEA